MILLMLWFLGCQFDHVQYMFLYKV